MPRSLPPRLAFQGVSLLLVLLGPPAVASEPTSDPPGGGPQGALARVLGEPVPAEELPDLRIDVGCLGDAGWRSVELYGDGLGFWGERAQIRVSPERIAKLLEAFRTSGFADWPETFGRTPEGPKTPPSAEGAGQPARLICRVRLAAGGEAKEVRQFDKGGISEPLRRLAYQVLEAGEEAASAGVRIDDLAAGLRKVLAGELDPRALEVQVHRRSEEPHGPEGTGWLLRIRGLEAELHRYDGSGGLGPAETHRLGRETFEPIARELVEHGVASLPANLWASEYTDLRVSVLGFSKDVQARRFAGMTATTHGERQADFGAVLDALRGLYRELAAPEADRGAG